MLQALLPRGGALRGALRIPPEPADLVPQLVELVPLRLALHGLLLGEGKGREGSITSGGFQTTAEFCKRSKLVAALIVAAFKRKHLANNIGRCVQRTFAITSMSF